MNYRQLYDQIKLHIVGQLKRELAVDLHYHCLNHTLDVEQQAIRIAGLEGITDQLDIFLLKVACLYHDSGFMSTYSEHEKAGCELASAQLKVFGIEEELLARIKGMIMATKIPQSPQNKLEEIICDADLDYLGRDDFWPISNDLFSELKSRNFLQNKDEWNKIQVKFFRQHNYFTTTSKKLRAEIKSNYLREIESLL